MTREEFIDKHKDKMKYAEDRDRYKQVKPLKEVNYKTIKYLEHRPFKKVMSVLDTYLQNR